VVSFTLWSLYPVAKNCGAHRTGGSVSPGADLDVLEKRKKLPLLGIAPRIFEPVAQPLY